MREWTADQCRRALKMNKDPEFTYADIGEILGGISGDAARGRLRRLATSDYDASGAGVVHSNGSIEAEGTGTIQDIMRDHGLDPEEWKAERVTVTEDKTWARFVRRIDPDAQTAIEIIEEAKSLLSDLAPRWEYDYKLPPEDDEPLLCELSIPDPHFGMLAWGEETMSKNRDTGIARQEYCYSVDKLLDRSGEVSTYLYCIGNDTFHTDQTVPGSNAGGATTRGTIQDIDTRPKKVFRTVTETHIETVEKMLDRDGRVDIQVVEGNHDRNTAFFLGEVLRMYYHNHPNVRVLNEPTQRKYYRWGDVLIGFTHGDNEKPSDLPLIMAQEAKDMWAETVYREWHLGHLHKKRSGLTLSAEEYAGVRVRWMPSITPRDAWHASKGYMHQLSAESLIWHPKEGQIGSAAVNLGVG